MTTQEKFEKFRQDYPIHFDRWQLKLAQNAWQACQAINDKERDSLIAENAMMREALKEVLVALENGFVRCKTCGDQEDTKTFDCLIDIKQALSAKPRLVEVGEVKDDGNAHNLHGELQLALCAMPAGTKLYTIQKGE